MQRRRAPRWLKWINPINRFLLRRGLGPAPQHLLTTTGRQTGTPRTTPVAVVEVDGERYVVAGFNASDWVANARATPRAGLRRGRQAERVELVEVPTDQRGPILARFAESIRGGRSFLTVASNAPRSAFDAAAPHHPVFRLRPYERA